MLKEQYALTPIPELSSFAKDIATLYLTSDFNIVSLQANTTRLNNDTKRFLDKPLATLFKFLNFTKHKDVVAKVETEFSEKSSFNLSITDRIGRKFLLDVFKLPKNLSPNASICLRITKTEEFYKAINRSFIPNDSFKVFYENDPIMHASINPNTGKIVDCNQFTLDSLKYASKDQLIGRSVLDIFHTSYHEKSKALIKKFNSTGKLRDEVVLLVRSDGVTIDAKLSSNAIYDSSGAIIRSQSTLTDITELKKSEEILAFQKEKLEHANVELEQFAAICSHDLKEPLNTIKISSEILALKYRNLIDAKGKSYFDYIGDATLRMADQINALMKHARLGIQSRPIKTNLNDILQQVLLDLRPRIRSANAIIIPDVLPTIGVYPTELRLLFQNLISNALKYSREGSSPQIKINVVKEDQFFIISFKDNGRGISKEYFSSIFNLFERADATVDRKGSGVGLAHCKKIAKLHGGDIWVESKVNVGSIFYVKILSNIDYLKADLSA